MWNHCCAILHSHLQHGMVLPYFSTLSHTGTNFGRKNMEHTMCVLIFSTFVWNISHSAKNSVRYYQECTDVFPLFLPDFKQTWIFSTGFQNILRHQISRKSGQWERSYSMRTDRQANGWTDVTMLMVAFCNFGNTPNKKWVTTITWTSVHCVLSTCLLLHRHRGRPKSYPTIISWLFQVVLLFRHLDRMPQPWNGTWRCLNTSRKIASNDMCCKKLANVVLASEQ